jgi:uncharacterized Fe-S cluster-containing radical SAM superfamily protein
VPTEKSASVKWIDTARAAERLRERVIDPSNRRVLVSRLAGSAQAQDFTLPANCGGFGRVRHFRRATAPGWPSNPLPIDPAAKALGLPHTDLLRAQAFQNAACAWRCWYCFVPFELLAGNADRGQWFTVDELLDLYLSEADRPAVIDLTGGSPDLTPEWVPWMMEALRARALDRSVYLWSDDNLSTDYAWRYLSAEQRKIMAEYPNYGRVACFKGFDAASFAFNTRAAPDAFEAQFELMGRLLALGLDCYGYATFTGASSSGISAAMARFVDRLQRLDENLPLRTIPLHIDPFTPVKPRLNDARREALTVQEAAIAAWNEELERRFSETERALPITEVPCGARYRS